MSAAIHAVGILELRRVTGVGDHDELRAGIASAIACDAMTNGLSCAPTRMSSGDAQRRDQRGKIVGLVRELVRHRAPHDLRHVVPLPRFELREAGTLRERRACTRASPARSPKSSSSFSACLPCVSATSTAMSMSVGIEAGDRTGRRVHHHERVDARRLLHRDLARDHAAHRVAEQTEVLEAGRVGDRERVGDEPLERIRRRIGRVVARAVPTMIEDHDGVIARQRRHVIGEVFLRAAEPVHKQQAGSVTGDFDLEPDPVVHRDPHPHMVTRNGRARQTGNPGGPALRT